MRQQHLADRAARLLQLGEIGELLREFAGLLEPARQQQRGGLRQPDGEAQQPGMFGGQRSPRQRLDVVEPTSPATLTACPTLPASIAKVALSASRVVRGPGSATRLRTVRRKAVARSGSLSIQNWFAARSRAQSISAASVKPVESTSASSASASRPPAAAGR